MKLFLSLLMILIVFLSSTVSALDRSEITFKVFQFPADQIPRIDGDISDWEMVPEDYKIRTDQLVDDEGDGDPETLDICVRIGWIKGLNRLYVLYEASDDYWDFSLPGLHNDTFELVVDGDASGGPLVDKEHRKIWTSEEVGIGSAKPDERISFAEANRAVHGVHAQNYHIFTPAKNKDWAMVWGVQPWIKELPWSNSVCKYNFKPGESGKLTLEFWITPFDYAGAEGAERSVPSILYENKIIGLSFAIIDYDDVNASDNNGFWNLSRNHKMYGNASYLCAFQLMPLESCFRKPVEADWTFQIIDKIRRRVAFKDQSFGNISSWHWDFGDGNTSTEQHPIHFYEKAGSYVVILNVQGPAGKARLSKVWDVTVE